MTFLLKPRVIFQVRSLQKRLIAKTEEVVVKEPWHSSVVVKPWIFQPQKHTKNSIRSKTMEKSWQNGLTTFPYDFWWSQKIGDNCCDIPSFSSF